MSKRFSGGDNDSPAKRIRLDITREQSSSQKTSNTTKKSNVQQNVQSNGLDDLWGDDFGEDEIEEMDFIASQATQEVKCYSFLALILQIK